MAVDLPHHHARVRPAVPPRADRRDRRLTLRVPTPIHLPPRDPPPGWTAGVADEAEHPRLRFEVLAMLLLAAVPSFIIGLQGITDPATVRTDDIGVLELLATVAAAAGPAVMAIHLLWRDHRLQSSGFAKRDAGFIAGYGAIGWVCCFIALIAASIVIATVYATFGGDLDALTETDDDGVTFTAASLAIAAVISLTAGLTEEVVFRAYAITRLEELGWKRAAYLVPALVFTALHLYQGVLAMLFIGAVAAVLTWLYKWRRSVWPVMVAHVLFDATQLTIAALTN